MPWQFPNLNALWAGTLVETLRCKGVEYAITCPGSRSSPLTIAFALNEHVEAIPILDERSAAFFALGIAKRTGRPVALICTSGSAVANFFPAIVEASESGVPLIVLTADRPAELRQCSAGQTIDQLKIYHGYARFELELGLPEADWSLLRYLRQSVSHACEAGMTQNPGPVHINVPLREPLAPILDPEFENPFDAESFQDFFSGLYPVVKTDIWGPSIEGDWLQGERGLILVGPNAPVDIESWTDSLAAFANALGWPLLSDALNPIRSRAERFQHLVTGYDFILRNEALKAELLPERVVVIGELPTCKVLRQWLAEHDLPMTILSKRLRNLDPTHSRSRVLLFDFECQPLSVGRRHVGPYTDRWIQLDATVGESLAARLEFEPDLFEGKLSWLLARELPEFSNLCVSNSMPPRDMEFYFGKCNSELTVFSSRGANGIDGILSTALGVAHRGGDTFLLTGDLALLHDSNGGLIVNHFEGSLTILLVNNSGGGIFEMLPVSKFESVFEKHFATDQEVDFEKWTEMYGASYRRIKAWDELSAALADSPDGVRVLELATDRKADVATRKRLFQEIAAELG